MPRARAAAKSAAPQLPFDEALPETVDEAPPPPEALIFCDGACSGNPGPGGWGCIVEQGGKRVELSGSGGLTTNNQMELQALIEGLKTVPPGSPVRVLTDSEYLVKGATQWLRGWIRNGWKTKTRQPVKNKELWEKLDELLSRRPHSFSWVKGHSGHAENERCDELAREAIAKIIARGQVPAGR